MAILKRKAIWLIFFCILPFHAFPQDYNFRNFNAEEGLAQPYVYFVMQDVQGYLWIGTGNGLSRYNGFIFENYTTRDSLADNFITCGIGDGEYLWFGHMNGQLSYLKGKKFHAVNMPQTDKSPITHFVKSPDGRIWIGTYSDGLLKIDKGTAVVKFNFSNEPVPILSFDFLDNHNLLIGTNTGLIYCRIESSGKIEIIHPVIEIPESKITCIRKMRNRSGFYIATENDGIFQLTREDNQFKASKIMADPDFDFTGIQDIYEDSQSNLWLGSFGNGLIKMMYSSSGKLPKIHCYNKASGFATDNVKTVYEDREGNIWSGNYGEGLTQVTPRTFSVIAFDKTQYGNDILSLYINPQSRWIGTENGLAKIDPSTGKIVKFYGKGSGLPKDAVTTLYSADGKELWIGTEKNGVFRLETGNEKIYTFSIGEGELENSITVIAGMREQVWIGTKKGLCSYNSDTKIMKWYSISQGGLPHNYINSLFVDRSGMLWVSTHSNTLATIRDGKVEKIPLNSINGILTLGPITQDTDSKIWVGSNGCGVFRIAPDSIINLTAKEGLLSDYCYSLIGDDHRNIWVGHKGGLSKISTTDFSVKPIQHFEGVTDNYQFNPNASVKDDQEKIWFGSDNGMVSYDPSMEYQRFLPPVLGITSIKINDAEIAYTDKIVLSPGKYKIRIDFLGISLKEPALVTYQHKLEGYDQWSEITKNTSITYNHLTEGEYTFFLNASSGDKAVTENPLTIGIIIKKPVWKKVWFYMGVVTLMVMLTYLYIKRREVKFLAEKRILEEKVRERTYEIQCQKNEIELQRDVIEQKNARITASITYASQIQNAVLPSPELIDKLLPDNFILSLPKDIVSGDFYWLTEMDNKVIFTVADGTGHGVPGAFMSLLGITLLNEIINVQGITRSDAIVTTLREEVIHSLQQTRKDITTTVGIDIALCVLDPLQKRIQFTGGMNDLVYIRDGKLEAVKADRFSVSALLEDSGPFTMKEMDYKKGDILYLFSDGYQDQFGGDRNKKYLIHRFYGTLLEIHKLPMKSQKEILEKRLYEWMKDTIQTDDITVMGIRL